MIEPRAQLQEYRERLYAQRNEMVADTVVRVIDIELMMLDQRLRRCTKEELDKLQGEVAAWTKLLKYIQQAPGVST